MWNCKAFVGHDRTLCWPCNCINWHIKNFRRNWTMANFCLRHYFLAEVSSRLASDVDNFLGTKTWVHLFWSIVWQMRHKLPVSFLQQQRLQHYNPEWMGFGVWEIESRESIANNLHVRNSCREHVFWSFGWQLWTSSSINNRRHNAACVWRRFEFCTELLVVLRVSVLNRCCNGRNNGDFVCSRNGNYWHQMARAHFGALSNSL